MLAPPKGHRFCHWDGHSRCRLCRRPDGADPAVSDREEVHAAHLHRAAVDAGPQQKRERHLAAAGGILGLGQVDDGPFGVLMRPLHCARHGDELGHRDRRSVERDWIGVYSAEVGQRRLVAGRQRTVPEPDKPINVEAHAPSLRLPGGPR